jgi:hypothetical protein
MVEAVAFSPDGTKVVTGRYDAMVQLWDVGSGALVATLAGHSGRVTSVAFSPDGKTLLTGSWDHTARLWDASSGALVRAFERHSLGVESVAFSPDGTKVLTGSLDHIARLWDVGSGALLRTFEGHSSTVDSVAFSPDGTKVLTGSWDSTIRLWNAGTGRELCSLVAFDDGTWTVVDPEGRFDAANSGDVDGLHWVLGDEAIKLSQFKDRFWVPGLLTKIVRGEPLPAVEGLDRVGLTPSIQVDPPRPGSSVAAIRLTDRGGGVGRVHVLVNGKEFAADARSRGFRARNGVASLSVDLSPAATWLEPGAPNTVEVVAETADGLVRSRAVRAVFTPRQHAPPVEPTLYAIVGGVSQYDAGPGSDLPNLRYAAHDAETFAHALGVGGARLFGASRVSITLLRSTSGPESEQPTKENFRRAFEQVAAKARAEDVLVVYLAGHGVSLRGGGAESDLYCFLTKGATTATMSDPRVRERSAITSEELTDWLTATEWTPGRRGIAARKQALILDTCAAGAAESELSLVARRDADGNAIRAIDRMAGRTGFFALMGSAADAVSYEATSYAEGLLTYSLLEAMRGAKLRQDEFADVSELFAYAADRVPQLARGIGGVQRPQVLAQRGAASFDIGCFTEAERAEVRVATPKPVVLRPEFHNATANFDKQRLSARVRSALDAEADATARGGQPAIVYVDGEEMPGAVQPAGGYTVAGETIHLDLQLVVNGESKLTVAVEGRATSDADLDEFARRVVEAIERGLQQLPRDARGPTSP